LLQSFLLTARIGSGEYVSGGEPQVAVRLTFSRTARFSNLDKLGKRAMSVGANDDLNAASHTFTIKCNSQAMGLRFTEQILKDQTRAFRSILESATYDQQGVARFTTDPNAASPSRAEDFASVIRQLADFGRSLYRAIGTNAPKALRDELRDLAATSDKTIQVVRYDANFVFPWPVIYDYPLPKYKTGEPPAPVCLGGMDSAAGNWTKSCAHGPQNPGYCIYGFWSVRHRVEQLVQLGDPLRDDDPYVQANPNAVFIAVDKPDVYTQQMVDAVRQKISAAIEMSDSDDLLDLLWQSQKRPTLLIVLGHLETQEVTGEPSGARIVLQPNKQWLQANDITDRQLDVGDWDDLPRTLVLLMACGSATTDINTLNDFFKALRTAGAAAIIGTECTAFTALVSRFAREVTLDIWDKKSLGDAVKLFNRRLMAERNPLAFVFNYLGDADLTVVT